MFLSLLRGVSDDTVVPPMSEVLLSSVSVSKRGFPRWICVLLPYMHKYCTAVQYDRTRNTCHGMDSKKIWQKTHAIYGQEQQYRRSLLLSPLSTYLII